jgi:prevent-host-death family protein
MADDIRNTVDVETLDADMSAIVESAASGRPVVVTRDGRPIAVVLDIRRLDGLRRERELLRRLALGELEAAAGEGDDLEAVLDDCALLLEES